MLDDWWGKPMEGPLPAGADGVWRVFIDVTVPDVAVGDRWGDMTIEHLPGVLAIRTTGVSEGEREARLDLGLEVLAATEDEARWVLWTVVDHELSGFPGARQGLRVERELVELLRIAGPEDVPAASAPPSNYLSRQAWVTEMYATPDDSESEPYTGPPLPSGLFGAHWDGRLPHRDFARGPQAVSLREALDWALAQASRVVLRIGNDGDYSLGPDRNPKLPDGAQVEPPDRSALWPDGTPSNPF